jgi:hypothetical protein
MPAPTTIPDWVSDANAADPDIVVEPPAGKREVGWAPTEKMPAQYENWFNYWVSKWIAYLATESADDFDIADALSVFRILIDAGGHIDLGNGTIRHQERTLWLQASAGQPATGGWVRSGSLLVNDQSSGSSGDIVVFPVPIEAGKRIRSITFLVDDGAIPTPISCDLRRIDTAGTATTVTGIGASAGTGAVQNVAHANLTNFNHTIVSTHVYEVVVYAATDAELDGVLKIYGISIVYDQVV